MKGLLLVPWALVALGAIFVLIAAGGGMNQSEAMILGCFLGIVARILQADVHRSVDRTPRQ